jgi:ribosomal protein S18 acetylase RimI-like enzyme
VYDTTAVGRHLIRPSEGLWDFLDLAILPAYQNRGIETYAFSVHLQEAIQARAAVRLSVRINNRAKRLYERLGFVVTEKDGMYYWMEYR